MLRNRLIALSAVALLATGCGESGSTVTTTGELGAALSQSAEVSSFRVSLSTAQTLKIPAAGIDATTEIDEQAPTAVGEVSGDRSHFVMDLGPLLGAIAGEELDIGFEMWINDERLVIDTRDYQQLLEQNPDAQFGPFDPGIFYVDLTDFEADSNEVLAAIGGSAAPDLKELAEKLPTALTSIEQTSSDPETFTGTISYADLLEVQGSDVDALASGAAAGVALNFPMSVDALTELYLDFYRATEVEVVIELDERGLLRVLSTRADLSGLYSLLFDKQDLLPGMTESERQEALAEVEGVVHTLETRSVYEVDDDLEVPLPPATTDDRTDQWRELLTGGGGGTQA